MHVFVTGGLGFVGSAVVDLFAATHSVTALGRPAASRHRVSSPNVRFVEKTLAEIVAADVERADLVVHAAALVDSGTLLRAPFDDVDTNVTGTLRVLEACKVRRPRLVVLSSDHVYGNGGLEPVNEASPCRPTSLYGATKVCAESMAVLHGRAHGYPVSIVRLTNVYGARGKSLDVRTSVLNLIIDRALRGAPVEVHGGGSFSRDFLYISDAAAAIQTVAANGRDGEVYLAAAGEQASFGDIVEMVLSKTGRKSERVDVGAPAAGLRSIRADPTKLRALGWRAMNVEEGVSRTLRALDGDPS